jgi:osmotically-inducible protein OsmY
MRTAPIGVALAAALALAACDRASMDNADREGAAIGQKANEALARTKEGLVDAGRKARDTLSQATTPAPDTRPAAPAQPASGNTSADASATSATTTTATSTSKPAGETGRQAREALADAAITASIKTDFLKDPDLSVLKIDVDTRDGVVTLNGLAENDTARTRAEHIAEGIKGVRQVRNFLVTKRT